MARETRRPGRGLRPNARGDRGAAPPAERAPVPVRRIARPQEMLMRATPVIGQEQPQLRTIVREGLTALCKAWAAYSLKRAIADVASTSEQDYRHFGLDKTEILQALSRLHEAIGSGGPLVPERFRRGGAGCPLAIMVRKARERGQPIRV